MPSFPILSAQVRWDELTESMNKGFGFRGDSFTYFMLAFLVVLAGVVIAVRVAFVLRERRGKLFSHPQLFTELANAHGLDRKDETLLRELAELIQLDPPTLLFVRQDRFVLAAERWAATSRNRADIARLASLEHRLFGPESLPERTAI